MSGTRVGEVLEYLVSNVPDVLRPVAVSEGWPSNLEREHLVILDATMDQEYRTMSARRPGGPNKSEDAIVNMWLVLTMPGEEATDVRRRAFDIFDQFDTWLRRNGRSSVSLNGTVCWCLLVPVRWQPGVGDNAREGALHIELRLTEMRL
jgi:hypothetical protein